MRILLIRHGQSESNVTAALDSQPPGAFLTEAGRAQAAELAIQLKDEPLEAIYVSGLARSQQTAEPLADAHGLTPTIDQRFNEVSAGHMEGSTEATHIGHYFDTVIAWFHGEMDRVLADAESGSQALSRMSDALADIAESGAECAAVIGHGTLMSIWCAVNCEGLSGELVLERQLVNTGVVVIEGKPGQWRALSWMDTPIEDEAK